MEVQRGRVWVLDAQHGETYVSEDSGEERWGCRYCE